MATKNSKKTNNKTKAKEVANKSEKTTKDTKVKEVVKKEKEIKVDTKSTVVQHHKSNFWKNNKGIIIILVVLALLITLSVLIESNKVEAQKNIDYSVTSSDVQQWYTDTQSTQHVITVLALSTCGYCAQYKPIVSKIAEENNLKIYWFEVDTMTTEDSNAVQSTYNLEQYTGSSPYTAITYGGEFVTDTVGYMPEEDTIAFLKEAGAIK